MNQGTLQELWMEPVALIPKGLPKHLSDPIRFEPSVRMNNEAYINATHLVKRPSSYACLKL